MAGEQACTAELKLLQAVAPVPSVCKQSQLCHHYRAGWKARVVPSKPVQSYLLRLQAIAKQQPHLLIAHSFAMHAALMAGGQLTKRMLTKHVKLEPGKGTATFDYQASNQFLASNVMRMPGVWQ